MKKLVRIAATAAVLTVVTACAGQPVVKVPVTATCPPPRSVVRPHLPLSDLSPASPAADVVKAFAVSVELLAGYAGELETLLDGYRPGKQ